MALMIIPNRTRSAHAVAIIGGRAYSRWGWFGCQLKSYEWSRVPAGTERELDLDGRIFRVRVFTTKREGLFIRTTWTLPLSSDIDEANKQIRELELALQRLV